MYCNNHPTGPPAYEMVLTHYLFEQFLSFFLQRLVIYHHIVLITPFLFDNNQSHFLTAHLLFPILPLSSLILLKLYQTLFLFLHSSLLLLNPVIDLANFPSINATSISSSSCTWIVRFTMVPSCL